MDSIDFWKLCDQLSIVHAALLVAGYNPSDHQSVENVTLSGQPPGYDGAKHAILSGLRKGAIEGELKYEEPFNGNGEPYLCIHSSYVDVESLKAWLISKNVREHFFFFPEAKVSEFLDRDHPRYSPKLAAAVTAWHWLDDEAKLEGKTPKQAVQKWLRKHAAEYGICDDDGKPNESVVDSISQIVNWRTKGGAPRTPTKQDLEEKPISARTQMSVTRQTAPKTNGTSYELDDDIPF
ncbi:hypothetical protein ACFOOP_10155 [Marinicaulis aureus]|uniref:DUF1376 domain-containing protein n=1 Tax=Hyphococcus aureus TaxID=2666033 RepID=A0ABW1L0C2_9PROT